MIGLHKKLKFTRLPSILRELFRNEAIGGRLILLAAIVALVITNSKWKLGYESLWQTRLNIGLGSWSLAQDLRQWVSDGLMTFFFLIVGLEIKREIIDGELRAIRIAILPVAAAIGGMIVPALIYLTINFGQAGSHGWGIPIATDIAIAVGLLMLLGRRVPSRLRIFLLTLAIVDDIGAIIIIALFYNQQVNVLALIIAALLATVMALIAFSKYMTILVFTALGICIWLAIHASGINASITGVILGLLAPLTATKLHKHPFALRLERVLLPSTTFVIVPLFVFVNAGLTFKTTAFNDSGTMLTAIGIMLGLVIGKVVGVTGAAWLMVKLRLSRLPTDTNWSQLIGIGFLAGVGFTISIFITSLAFNSSNSLIDAAKVGIFAGSVLSAGLGLYSLKRSSTN